MFKLYKRDEHGQVSHYYEVWVEPQNRRIIEHWGTLGQQGEAEPHKIKLLRSLDLQVEDLLRPAREQGFVELDRGDHSLLLVD
ncbi:MAG: hypothetical protein AAF829_05785, partial [Pseudomonadota bacterium]